MAITDETEVSEQVEPRDEIVAKLARGEPEAKGTRITAESVFRFIVLIAIIAFLGVYVGPSALLETLIKVAVAVILSAALFVGANLLFDLAYDRWALFNTIVGAICGFVLFGVLDNMGVLRPLYDQRLNIAGQGPFDVNGWLWALIGGAALALVMFLLSAPRQQLARLPLAVIGFTAFGILTAFAFDESVRPELDFTKLFICVALGAVLMGGIGLARGGAAQAPKSALTGAGIGWLVGAWGGGNIGDGNLNGVLYATVIPAAILGVRFGLTEQPSASRRRRIEQKSRAWIFLTPALTLMTAGLVIPLIITIYQSFRNRNNTENVGWANYEQIFTDDGSFNLDNWSNFLTSQLFYVALGMVAVGVIAGIVTGRKTRQKFERGEVSMIPIYIGFFLLACAVLSTVRGTIFNNIWWVIVVTTLSTALGLGVAVLADRSKGENVAKSLIFLPMAISFVGAGIIWRFMYIARPPTDTQTGVMNAIWVWLGSVSSSTTGKIVAVAVLGIVALAMALLLQRALKDKRGSTAGCAAGFLLLMLYFIYRFLGPGLGGASADGDPETVLFQQEPQFNNMWLMVVLIWIQTGFAMVILSSAIKAVPTKLTETAKIDGATESQIFWRVTMPQIAPTVGVVVTTLIVTVMKVFDIVKVTTNGNFDTQVIANQMFEAGFSDRNLGLGSSLATILFVSVLPIMYINIRRMQSQRV
jgi:alpha-glucoside transport system permease protein